MAGKITNQAAIDAAIRQNAVNAAKTRAAATTISNLQPRLPAAQQTSTRAQSLIDLATKIGKKTDDASKTQPIVDKASGIISTNQSTIIAPYEQALRDVQAFSNQIAVPAAIFEEEEEAPVRTLAIDVFRQTLGMFFGETEMQKPWVNELYSSVSKFYKSGSTADESFNLAVLDVQKNPNMTEFTKRFKGIYALQEMKQKGQAVTVPTVAEYFATEAKMGDILKQSSLGELANEDFLGDVLAKGVSATEFANRISAIFDRIDNAPKETKDTISRFFPSVDRVSLAKAIALGDKGAKELQSKVAGYEVLSAAEQQGLGASATNPFGVTEASAYQYALSGETFDTALTKFGTVAAALPTVNKLTQIYGQETIGQAGLESAIFGKSAADIKRLEDIAKKEEASFSGRSGVSQVSLASQRRAAGLI